MVSLAPMRSCPPFRVWASSSWFSASDEQGLVKLFFQDFNGLAYGRLGDKELLGSLGKAQRYRHMVKYLIKFIVNIHY